ncbi:unnamed protein product [Callosobruchus maculatus]|uniref:Uncharacterized protein n=1 Tax=Callosobruchus maculatus TaxID=64391 RepID=A0A653DDM5_CALMS|nr:unnamed protein product [Callosobruchus maculatus]
MKSFRKREMQVYKQEKQKIMPNFLKLLSTRTKLSTPGTKSPLKELQSFWLRRTETRAEQGWLWSYPLIIIPEKYRKQILH